MFGYCGDGGGFLATGEGETGEDGLDGGGGAGGGSGEGVGGGSEVAIGGGGTGTEELWNDVAFEAEIEIGEHNVAVFSN